MCRALGSTEEMCSPSRVGVQGGQRRLPRRNAKVERTFQAREQHEQEIQVKQHWREIKTVPASLTKF